MSSGRIPREFINELLTRIDIVDLIDGFVPLKKVGVNFTARCPFHTEKSPSFSVNRNKQFYHCFGCGVSGNAISFLMDFNHLDFVEAIEDLASFAGIDVPKESYATTSSQSKDNSNSVYAVMEHISAFYIQQLRSNTTAIEYLKNRGISGQIAKIFMLGYAPDAWRSLNDYFDKDLLVNAGMLVLRDDGSGYDRFRNRIMFPIRDKRGRTIGFGGRVLDTTLPKYLNSPETALFHKGKEIYGLYEALQINSKPQRFLIVEGYIDVITLAQAGIPYAVATLGTATSQTHLDLLFRFSSELIFCFDGDKAGRDAAWRAMDAVLPAIKDGRSCRIMLLPQHHDPDSLIREEGIGQFTERINNAQALSNYFFEQMSAALNLSEMEGRSQLLSKAKPYLEKLPEGSFKEMMLIHLKELTDFNYLATPPSTSHREQTTSSHQKQHRAVAVNNRLSSARTAIALLLQNPRLITLIQQKNVNWNELEFSGSDLLKDISRTIEEHQPSNAMVLLELYRDKPQENAVKKLMTLDLMLDEAHINQTFDDALTRLLIQAKSTLLEKLLRKGAILMPQEKEILRKLLAQK